MASPKPKTRRNGTASPSQRLAAEPKANAPKPAKPKPSQPATQQPALDPVFPGHELVMTATKMKVATKFIVTDKTEMPVVVDRELRTHWYVKLEAVYEPKSILNGLATIQGNADNRIFGDDTPEAAIGMVIHSKAIADTFPVGRAFGVVFSEIVSEG